MLPWRRRIFASGNLYNNKILSKCGNSLSLPIDKDQLDNLLYKGIALAFCSISLLLIMMMYLAHSLPQWWCISINTNGRGVRVKSHGQFQSLMTPISMLFSTASYYRKQMNLVQDHPNQWTKAQLHVPWANFALIN